MAIGSRRWARVRGCRVRCSLTPSRVVCVHGLRLPRCFLLSVRTAGLLASGRGGRRPGEDLPARSGVVPVSDVYSLLVSCLLLGVEMSAVSRSVCWWVVAGLVGCGGLSGCAGDMSSASASPGSVPRVGQVVATAELSEGGYVASRCGGVDDWEG